MFCSNEFKDLSFITIGFKDQRTNGIRNEVARLSLTVLSQAADKSGIPINIPVLPVAKKKVAYVGIGLSELNGFASRMKGDFKADVFMFSYKDSEDVAGKIVDDVAKENYDVVVVGIHNYSNRPANNYAISSAAINLWKKLNSSKFQKVLISRFGAVARLFTFFSKMVWWTTFISEFFP